MNKLKYLIFLFLSSGYALAVPVAIFMSDSYFKPSILASSSPIVLAEATYASPRSIRYDNLTDEESNNDINSYYDEEQRQRENKDEKGFSYRSREFGTFEHEAIPDEKKSIPPIRESGYPNLNNNQWWGEYHPSGAEVAPQRHKEWWDQSPPIEQTNHDEWWTKKKEPQRSHGFGRFAKEHNFHNK